MKVITKRIVILFLFQLIFKNGSANNIYFDKLKSDSISNNNKITINVNAGVSQLFYNRNNELNIKGIETEFNIGFKLFRYFLINAGYTYYGNNFKKVESVNFIGHVNYLSLLNISPGISYSYKKYQMDILFPISYGNGLLNVYNTNNFSAYDFVSGNIAYSWQLNVFRQINDKVQIGIYYNNLFRIISFYSNYLIDNLNISKSNQFQSIGIKFNYILR